MSADTATFRLSEDDYLRAGALAMRMGARHWLVIGVVLAACAALALWGPDAGVRAAGIGGAVGCVLTWLLIRCVLSPWMLRRHYRSYKAIQGEQTVSVRDEGVQFFSDSGESRLRWDKVFKWRRDDAYILVYVMPRLYHLVPRRVAEQGFDIAGLEAALAQHVGPPQ